MNVSKLGAAVLLLLLAGLGLTPGEASAEGATPATGVLTRAPALKQFVAAPYPPAAEAARIEGAVVLQLDLSETGAVSAAEVLRPLGSGCDEAALAAVGQFQFEPAEIDGKPAAVRITYSYEFVLRPAPVSEQVKKEGPVNLSGRLLERGTRKPLPSLEVALPELGRSVAADAEGRFSFRDVPPGPVQVTVVAAGYQRFETREEVAAGEETRLTLYLERRFFSPYESVVRSQREKKEVSRTTLQAEEVQRIPGTQGDTLKVVQNLPGVARSSFNGGALVIRGSSPNDSGVFLDGERVPILFHFAGLTSVYPSELLEAVDYLPGSFSSFYGDITGGVVDVRSRSPRKDGLHGAIGVSLLESSLVLEGPLTDTVSISLGARRSYVDLLLGFAPRNAGPAFDVAPRYHDGQLKLEWRPSVRHTLTLLALTSDDVLALLFDRPGDADPSAVGQFRLETGFTQLRLRHVYRGGGLRLDTTAMVGSALVNVQVGSSRGFLLKNRDLALRHTAELELNENLTAAGGVDVLDQTARITADLPQGAREGELSPPGAVLPQVQVDSRFRQYFPGIWAELRVRPVKSLLLVPGLRSESYLFTAQRRRDRSLNPRLAVRYALSDELTLKGGAGVYHSPPRQGEPTAEFGNPEIRAKRADQYSLGLELRVSPEIFISAEGFYTRLSSFIVGSLATVVRDGEAVQERLNNDGIGRVYGGELLVRHALTSRFFGWLAYTLSRSERRDHPDSAWRLFDNDQTHVLTAIASYKLGGGWEAGARFRLASGNPTTPVIGAIRDDNADVFVPRYGAVNSARLPAFHQLDLRVDKIFVFDLWSLDVFLDVTNAYNNRAVEGVTYSYDFSQKGYFTGLPILPILGAKGSF